MTYIDGNDIFYSLEKTQRLPDNVLTGKTFYFLGSSVTCGAGSMSEGMGDFIAKRNGCICIKEAVSSTTLADIGEKSYVSRFENYVFSNDRVEKIDSFICQLSTNDRSHQDNFGQITANNVKDITSFDKTTTFGAIEYIIALCKNVWNCPIIFYTGTYFESDAYEIMISALKQIAKKWDITILDLFYDVQFNAINKEQYDLYMLDPVHPKRAGYREWWVPAFEKCLKSVIE